MEGEGVDLAAPEFVGDVVGGVLPGHEDEHLFPLVGGDEMAQQGGALVGVDSDGALGDGCFVDGGGLDVDAGGIVEEIEGDGLEGGREGGGEEEVLAALGKEGEDAVEFIGKAEIEHAVSFVEDEGRDAVEVEGVVIDEVEQASWGGDHEVGTSAEGHHLGVDGHSAHGADRFDFLGEVEGELLDDVADLGGEFSGGDEDEGVELAWLFVGRGEPALEEREDKGGGLAGAGLSGGQDIAAIEDDGDRGRLHRGRGRMMAGGADQGGHETEGGEGHGGLVGPIRLLAKRSLLGRSGAVHYFPFPRIGP